MTRLHFTSLVTTHPSPQRWTHRLTLLAVAIAAAGAFVGAVVSDQVTMQVPLLCGIACAGLLGVLYALRASPSSARHAHGAASYVPAVRGRATFEGSDGVAVHVDRADLRGVELDAADVLVLTRRDRTAVCLADTNRARLLQVAADLGFAVVRRVEGDSPVNRLPDYAANLAWFVFMLLLPGTLFVSVFMLRGAYRSQLDVPLLLAAIVMVPASVLVVRAFIPRDLRVGADGLSYRTLTGNRFLPHARIAKVLREDKGVRLTLVDGREMVFHPPLLAGVRLVEYLEDARAAARGAVDAGALGALLDRGARSLADWKRAAEGLATNTGGYRGLVVTPDQLRVLVDDGGAPPERRVAAALALRSSTGESDRIRLAAQSSADDELRAALEAAAEGEIAEDALLHATARHVRGDTSAT